MTREKSSRFVWKIDQSLLGSIGSEVIIGGVLEILFEVLIQNHFFFPFGGAFLGVEKL